MTICSTPECGKEVLARGLCKTCYYRRPEYKEKKKAYYTSEPRLKVSRLKSKTPSVKASLAKFQKTEKFQKIQTKYRMTENARFGAGRRQAIKRKVLWDLTLEQYKTVIQQVCHYCEGPISEFGHNLDRKDNQIGYVISNVVTCCGDCNRTKGDRLSYLEMVAVGKLLRQMRGSI